MGKHESQWEHRRARWEAKRAAKQARREWRAQRRRERRQRRSGPAAGAVFALAALVCLGFALRDGMGWMVFVALGLALRAASALSAPRAPAPLPQDAGREGTAAPAPDAAPPARAPAAPTASPTREVDALCDALLAELKAGPGLLREVLHQPEATVEALRSSCHALAAREEELLRLNPPEQTGRLERERQALRARVDAERDAVTRERLEGALAALEAQLRQREELRTAAARLSAEHTRLRYVLENLRAQVLRVRSASAASADEAGGLLRSSVAQLQAEMDAVAEALESVAHAPPAAASPAGASPEDALPSAGPVSAVEPLEADAPARRGRVRG